MNIETKNIGKQFGMIKEANREAFNNFSKAIIDFGRALDRTRISLDHCATIIKNKDIVENLED